MGVIVANGFLNTVSFSNCFKRIFSISGAMLSEFDISTLLNSSRAVDISAAYTGNAAKNPQIKEKSFIVSRTPNRIKRFVLT